jgi:hypothetical protein
VSKHTPGPWAARDGRELLAGPGSGFIPYGACGCCDSPWINGDDDGQVAANARLIATAPDLLAALQEIAAMTGYVDCDVCTDVTVTARAAIAKATQP